MRPERHPPPRNPDPTPPRQSPKLSLVAKAVRASAPYPKPDEAEAWDSVAHGATDHRYTLGRKANHLGAGRRIPSRGWPDPPHPGGSVMAFHPTRKIHVCRLCGGDVPFSHRCQRCEKLTLGPVGPDGDKGNVVGITDEDLWYVGSRNG